MHVFCLAWRWCRVERGDRNLPHPSVERHVCLSDQLHVGTCWRCLRCDCLQIQSLRKPSQLVISKRSPSIWGQLTFISTTTHEGNRFRGNIPRPSPATSKHPNIQPSYEYALQKLTTRAFCGSSRPNAEKYRDFGLSARTKSGRTLWHHFAVRRACNGSP